MLRTLSSSSNAAQGASERWVSDRLQGRPFPVEALSAALSAHEDGRALFANLAFVERVLSGSGASDLAGVPLEVMGRAADEVRDLSSFHDQTLLQLLELQLREQIAAEHDRLCASEDFLIPAPHFGRLLAGEVRASNTPTGTRTNGVVLDGRT
jgi:hypothetical protein